MANAQGFLDALPGDGLVIDLGSGGGLPGLVIAVERPALELVLLDSSKRRTDFLVEVCEALDLVDRVLVVRARAEEYAREPGNRCQATAVVARSFGPPAVTAECGAPLLRAGGVLLVSEPPGDGPGRWPSAGLAELGLELGERRATGAATIQTLVAARPCPDRYPRRVGIPTKRPLFPAPPSVPDDSDDTSLGT